MTDLDGICNSLFTEEELWAALRKLKASVSTTGDRLALTVKLMSAHTPSAQKLRAAVLQSFNVMWTTVIDTDLMTNRVTQIPKADKASSNAADFRSIAVSSGQSKLFQHMVEARLRRFIGPDCPRAAAIISRLQAGFMPGRSTTDQILLRDMAVVWQTVVQNGTAISVFIDLLTAYASVSHDGLLLRLAEVGITGQLWLCIKHCLDNLSMYVQEKDVASNVFKVRRGLPEGHIYSPTLFLIMFNPVLKAIEDLVARDTTTGIRIHTQGPDSTPLDFTIGTLAYADDAVALATGGKAGSRMMDVLHTSLIDAGMIVNTKPTKTAVIAAPPSDVWRRKGTSDTMVDNVVSMVMEDGSRTTLHQTTAYKYLGVNIGAGSGLARQSPEHINGVVKTARWLYICLIRAGITEVPIDTARVIYQCLYLPKITYGLGVVIADSRRLPAQLLTIERTTLRVFLQMGRKCPNAVLYSIVGGKSLQSTVVSQQLSTLIRVLQMDRQHHLRQALTAQAVIWSNPSTPRKVKSLLHYDTYASLVERIDGAITWIDEQNSADGATAVPYAVDRSRQWQQNISAILLDNAHLTEEGKQQMVARMAADARAVVYILALQQHRAELEALPSMQDVAWMSQHLVAAPFTSTCRTTANRLRVQLRGGMRVFLPWETFSPLREWKSGCRMCDNGDKVVACTVTHLLKDCKHEALEKKRREVWQHVVHFARTNGIAGPLLDEHALDFAHPRMRECMHALTVGEEFSSDFINVGLDGWRQSAVAKIVCCQQYPAQEGKDSGVRSGSSPVTTSGGKDCKGADIGMRGHRGSGIRPRRTRGDSTKNRQRRQTPAQRHAYQRLLNITGAMLLHAAKTIQDFVADMKEE
jgi:hypothetical protein